MMRIFARVLRIFADNLFPDVMKKILNERIAISSSNPIRARFYDTADLRIRGTSTANTN